MRRRTRFTFALTTLFTLILLACAGVIIRQPQVVGSSSTRSLRSVIGELTPPFVRPAMERFPAGSRVAGVAIGGRTPAEAQAVVAEALTLWQKPLPLAEHLSAPAPDAPLLDLGALGVVPDAEALIREAVTQANDGKQVDVAWQPGLDPKRLREALAALAPRFGQPAARDVAFAEGDPPSITFRAQTSTTLDIDATTALIEQLLRAPSPPVTRTAVLRTGQAPGTLADLDAALRRQMQSWDGVAAVTVHDLATDEWLAINDETVFSGASVMKVPIMVYAYSKLGQLDTQQQGWLEATIMQSNNTTANNLLAAGAGGQGTEAALRGAHELNDMLHELGLQHTFSLVPYESTDWLAQHGLLPEQRPDREGAEPFTKPGRFIRTTPRDMVQFFTMLVECSEGRGPLLRYKDGALTQAACVEMLGWLRRPHDTERMMAGIPDDVQVAHKGGWLADMQADVGIVYSPDRTYVAAIYLWREGLVSDANASPSPYLGALSHTIYSFYNPE